MKIKCLIVDDEPLAIDALRALLKRLEYVDIVVTCQDGLEAFQILQNQKIDLIFLDIEMPELSGMKFLKSLQNPPKVIFTTAYREYAVEAFDLDVVDYLLKPISFERLLKALDRYHKKTPSVQHSSKASQPTDDSYLFIKVDKVNIKLRFSDILYIEGMKDYIQIHTVKEILITKLRMNQVEKLLPSTRFLRIHRSFIVSLYHLKGFSPTSIFIGKRELPIGRNYKDAVMKILDGS